MKVIIIGGVAGGASCAARLRRLDETANIVLVERGPYISYANCGLPYHVGGVIEKETSLLIADEKVFRQHFAIDVRTQWEAIQISPREKSVQLRQVHTGALVEETYDRLVLAPGAAPIRPPLPGIDLPGIFAVRTIPDARQIREWLGLQEGAPTTKKQALVVGGGFIGLEMAENLVHLGLEVALVQLEDQILAPLDREMARYLERRLQDQGLKLILKDGAAGFRALAGGGLETVTQSGGVFASDIVVLGIGVRPETALARSAGLEIGSLGGIRVDDQMRTSEPDIFAVGDAVEVKDVVTGQWSLVALAGPANRQGRIAADVICGRDSRFRGTQGTAIIGLFGLAAGWTGVNEKTLKRLGEEDYEKIYLYPNSHASYYPGAKPLILKLLFRRSDGKVLGVQVLGEEGVDKRIDTFALAIQTGATIYDLEEAELTYAPQFGSAKSPVNFAGMVAADVLRRDMPLAHWGESGEGFLLDVRRPEELAVERLPAAVNIPLAELRERLGELPRNRPIFVFCRSGQRAYYATRILRQQGFEAHNLSGGILSRSALLGTGNPPAL